MITLDEYKKVLGSKLEGLTDEELTEQYQNDTMLTAFVLKCWLGERQLTKVGKE